MQGDTVLISGLMAMPNNVVFLSAHQRSDGAQLWLKTFCQDELSGHASIAAQPMGFVLGGAVQNDIDFGLGTLTALGDFDIVAASFTLR